MALTAYLDWAFPRRYDNKEKGVVYSCLFQNRYKRNLPRPMFILVVHSPPEDWVTLEVDQARRYDEQKSSLTGDMWRIEGLFSFNYNPRKPGQIPVLHANPVTGQYVNSDAVFLNCSNRKTPHLNYQFSIEIEDVVAGKKEAFVFVDNIGPYVAYHKGKKQKRYSNKLIGVVPKEAVIVRTLVAKTNNQELARTRFRVNPETGQVEEIGDEE